MPSAPYFIVVFKNLKKLNLNVKKHFEKIPF